MRRRGCLTFLVLLAVFGLVLTLFLITEFRSSRVQANYLAGIASELAWTVEPGPSSAIRFPGSGPFDQRLGYTAIPRMTTRLEERGFAIESQAVVSPRFEQLVDRGLFPIYREKAAGGLTILDRGGDVVFTAQYPSRLFPEFDSLSPVIVRTLLYIENRNLLDPRYPKRNPVIEWRRMGKAALEYAARIVGADRNIPGASTLATQVEKYRHSPMGITGNVREKLRQVASASVRIYLDGEETLSAQKRVILDYLNSVPVAAIPVHGEVNGLADALWAWYGLDHEEVAAVLRREGGSIRPEEMLKSELRVAYPEPEWADPDTLAQAGRAYRAVLSLLLAHRRPTWYLARGEGQQELRALTDSHLRRLAQDGIISPALRDAALTAVLDLRPRAPLLPPTSFVERKAANTVRSGLLSVLGVKQLYDLDRYDMTVTATVDRETQLAVSRTIGKLSAPEFLREHGLTQDRLLRRGDPSKVIYSFILFEHTPLGNVVRVQTDNYAQPLDLNTSGRLELGSTAKLRTLVTYLEIIEQCYQRLSPLSRAEADSVLGNGVVDALTLWTADWLRRNPTTTLEATLNAAMERRYSANPGERFVTGGGVHTFANFDKTHNNSIVSLREAIRHSINLPFIRLMRDIERYYLYRDPAAKAQILENVDDPRRGEYLARFADTEGSVFVDRFYRKLRSAAPDSLMERMLGVNRPSLLRVGWIYRTVFPDSPLEDFEAFLKRMPPKQSVTPGQIRDVFRRTDPTDRNLADQGYLARVHPLELWVARYLFTNPDATRTEVLQASAAARQEVYSWLFKTTRRNAQDKRIRSLLEVEAFLKINEAWKRLGYPFDNLTPSYASSIGSSGDRPVALAELVGILVNDGIRYPVVRVEDVHFAMATPFETQLQRVPAKGERVLSSEVASVARKALLDVVESGTARRIHRALTRADGTPIPIGGKTGTGDNRFLTTTAKGGVISSRAVSRTSTFVFFFGNRFFGVITAYVQGQEADGYNFTSALPVSVLRILGPELARLEGLSLGRPVLGPEVAPSGIDVEGVVTMGTGTGPGLEEPEGGTPSTKP